MSARLKGIIFAVFALAGIIGSSGIALAGWCWSDPVIDVAAFGVESQRVNIVVGIQDTDLKHLDGAVDVTIKLPPNVKAEVVYMDNIIPENVRFQKEGRPWKPGQDIEMSVKIHARSKGPRFPVAVLIEHQSKNGNGPQMKEGQSGKDLTANYTIKVN